MSLGHHVESYRFWDVVVLWARETLQHEVVVARALANAVVSGGLRVQSIDPAWRKVSTLELRGSPLIRFMPRPGVNPVLIRSTALQHLKAIVHEALEPNPQLVHDEFIVKQDFKAWVQRSGLTLPSFWFAVSEHA